MPHIDQLYAEFVQAWQAGQAPEVDPYLDRADPADQDELAERLETFVMVAPSVELAPERAAQIEALPAFLRAASISDENRAPSWATRLRAARERAGLSLADLGARFAASFGLDGRESRAATMLRELEDGELDASRVSGRATDRLADLLGVAADALRPPPRPAPLFRAEDDAAADLGGLLADAQAAMAAPADHDGGDELDELLRGG
jgi:transcriptional regulator with XRE-family HTH domain